MSGEVWVVTQGGIESEVVGVYGTLDAAKAANHPNDWVEDRHGRWRNGATGWRRATITSWPVDD